MLIYEQLSDLYLRSGYPEGTLQKDITHYLRTGYVFATPEYFIMGQRIDAGWYVHAAVGVGALEGFLRHMPYYLPYIGWERRGTGKVRWYQTTKITNKLLKGQQNEITKSTGTDSTTCSK